MNYLSYLKTSTKVMSVGGSSEELARIAANCLKLWAVRRERPVTNPWPTNMVWYKGELHDYLDLVSPPMIVDFQRHQNIRGFLKLAETTGPIIWVAGS